jgi:preprotein translocase subunit SecF
VVVFDKVRENTAGLLGGSRTTYSQAANLALNQTLVRSINTSLIALLPVGAILVVASTVLAPGNELGDLSLVLFVGMLSGTYSSIFIATPVLTQLKEREPQYRSLAKRISVRESGGRTATRRTAAKAGTGAGSGTASRGARGTASATALADDEDLPPGFDDLGTPQDDELVQDDVPAPAGRAGGPSYTTGPRQQPRRDGRNSSARRRPAGKKKRR